MVLFKGKSISVRFQFVQFCHESFVGINYDSSGLSKIESLLFSNSEPPHQEHHNTGGRPTHAHCAMHEDLILVINGSIVGLSGSVDRVRYLFQLVWLEVSNDNFVIFHFKLDICCQCSLRGFALEITHVLNTLLGYVTNVGIVLVAEAFTEVFPIAHARFVHDCVAHEVVSHREGKIDGYLLSVFYVDLQVVHAH